MLMYALIGLSLVLTGIAGLQFMYLFYIDRVFQERVKHIRVLERRNAELEKDLAAADKRLAEQDELIARLAPSLTTDDDAWADVID